MVAARHPERLHPVRPAGAGALRLARHPGAARGLSHDHHPDLGALPVPAQDRDGRGLLDAAAARHRAAAVRAEEAARAGAATRRSAARAAQRRTIPLGALALPRARRLPRRHGLRGLPALRHPRQGRLLPRLGPAAHLGELHARPTGRSRSSYSSTQARHRQHARAGRAHGLRRRRARRAARLRHQPASSSWATRSWRFLALAPVVIPGVVLAVGALHRLHAAAVPALRHALDPLHRLSDQGDARRLLAVRRDVPRASTPSWRRRAASWARGGCACSARSRRRSPGAGIIATWCFIFIGVIRELSASIILFTPEHQGHVGGDLRPQGGGPVRRHRRPRPVHAGDDLRHRRARCRRCSAATSWARGRPSGAIAG